MTEAIKQTLTIIYLLTKQSLWGNVTTIRDTQTHPYNRQQATTQLVTQLACIGLIFSLLGPFSPFNVIEQGWDDKISNKIKSSKDSINDELAQFMSAMIAITASAFIGAKIGDKLGQGLYGLWSAIQTKGEAWSAADRPLHDETIIKTLNEIKEKFLTSIDAEENQQLLEDTDSQDTSFDNDSVAIPVIQDDTDIEQQGYMTQLARELDQLFNITQLRQHMKNQISRQFLDNSVQAALTDNDTLGSSTASMQTTLDQIQNKTRQTYPIFYQFVEQFADPQKYYLLEAGLLRTQQFIIEKKHECQRKYTYNPWPEYQECLQEYGDITSPIKFIIWYSATIHDLARYCQDKLDKINQCRLDTTQSHQYTTQQFLQTKIDLIQQMNDIIKAIGAMTQKPAGHKMITLHVDPLEKDKQTVIQLRDQVKQNKPNERFFAAQINWIIDQLHTQIQNSFLERLQQEKTKLEPLETFSEQLGPIIDWLNESFSDRLNQAEDIEPYQYGQQTASDYIHRSYPDELPNRQILQQDHEQLRNGIDHIFNNEFNKLTPKADKAVTRRRPQRKRAS